MDEPHKTFPLRCQGPGHDMVIEGLSLILFVFAFLVVVGVSFYYSRRGISKFFDSPANGHLSSLCLADRQERKTRDVFIHDSYLNLSILINKNFDALWSGFVNIQINITRACMSNDSLRCCNLIKDTNRLANGACKRVVYPCSNNNMGDQKI